MHVHNGFNAQYSDQTYTNMHICKHDAFTEATACTHTKCLHVINNINYTINDLK